MKKNILIISSSPEKNQLLVDLFEELKEEGYSYYLLSSTTGLLKKWERKNWPAKKIYLGPALKNKANSLLFIILLPILFFAQLIRLAYCKYKKKIQLVICLHWNEKITATLIAKLLGIKIIWLEYPNINYQAMAKPLLVLYSLSSSFAEIIAFANFTKIQLKKLGIKEEKIHLITPGIKLNQYEYQDTIFNELAQADHTQLGQKFYTIGAVAELNKQQNIEMLLRAVKICFTVINNIQLIIVGEGEERKNLTWLARKMEIDNLVWFVGEQSHLRKWFDSFDVFVVTGKKLNYVDLDICLKALAAGLPIIGSDNSGLEEIITTKQNETGILIKADDSEILARQIINLQQNKSLRLRLGKNGQARVRKYFSIEKTIAQFKKILN